MKKILFNFLLIFSLIAVIFFGTLSLIGIKTTKLNSIISERIEKTDQEISTKLEIIKFKLDLKELSLYAETENPEIYYKNFKIPIKNIKLYIDFISLIKSKPKIQKIKFSIKDFEITKVKNLNDLIKPSNIKTLLNNSVKEGFLNSTIEIFLNSNNSVQNFIAKGTVSNLRATLLKDFEISKVNFKFFADNTDILFQNITGKTQGLKISKGNVKLIYSPELSIQSDFSTIINYNEKLLENYYFLLPLNKNFKRVKFFEGNLNNNLSFEFDRTLKVKKFDFKTKGTISSAKFNFAKPVYYEIIEKKIDEIFFKNSNIETYFNPNKSNLSLIGEYSLDKSNFLEFELKNFFNKKTLSFNTELNLDYDNKINLGLINYTKLNKDLAKIKINFDKIKGKSNIKEFSLSDNKNQILVENLRLDNFKPIALDKLKVMTFKNGEINNDFSVLIKKNIIIKGSSFDARNLIKYFNKTNNNNNLLSNLNKEIEIDFKKVFAPVSEKIMNFKLIGAVEKGKFYKKSSKGEFRKDKFLDISMKNDRSNKKKYLEIYSDLAKPLLSEFSFFNGLSGGNLLFSSVIDSNSSISKLKIENFKLINAPNMVKLLSLADLGGLADLAEGEGLSFDILEASMENKKNFLKLNEVYAVGPSISILMEGYRDQNQITSIRGTLIQAKKLNKLISKKPVIVYNIIKKEFGEGHFVVSFKMKGPPGKIKTTINPIKTLTPRFIQKIIEKNKNSK